MIWAGRQIREHRPALAERRVDRGGVQGRGTAVAAERRVRLELGRAGMPWEALDAELAARLLGPPSASHRLPAWATPADAMRGRLAAHAASGMADLTHDDAPALRDSSSFDPQHILTDLLPHGRGLNLGRRPATVERGQVVIPGTGEAELDRLVTWAPIGDGPVTLGTTLRLALDAYYKLPLDDRRAASFPFVEVWMLGSSEDEYTRWHRRPVQALLQFNGSFLSDSEEQPLGLTQVPRRPPFLRLRWPAGARYWDRFPLFNQHAGFREVRTDGTVRNLLVSTAPIPEMARMLNVWHAAPDYERLLRGSHGRSYKDLFYLALWLQGNPTVAAIQRVPPSALGGGRDTANAQWVEVARNRWSRIVDRLARWRKFHPEIVMPRDYEAGPAAPQVAAVPDPAPAAASEDVQQVASAILQANPRHAEIVVKWRAAAMAEFAPVGKSITAGAPAPVHDRMVLMRHFLEWRLRPKGGAEWQRIASAEARPLIVAQLSELRATEVEQLIGATVTRTIEVLVAHTLVRTLGQTNARLHENGRPAIGFDHAAVLAMVMPDNTDLLNTANKEGREYIHTWRQTVHRWLDEYVMLLHSDALNGTKRQRLATALLAAMQTWPATAAAIRARHAESE